MKNRRSLFVNSTRPRTFRCSTISCCLSAAFSASSRKRGSPGWRRPGASFCSPRNSEVAVDLAAAAWRWCWDCAADSERTWPFRKRRPKRRRRRQRTWPLGPPSGCRHDLLTPSVCPCILLAQRRSRSRRATRSSYHSALVGLLSKTSAKRRCAPSITPAGRSSHAKNFCSMISRFNVGARMRSQLSTI
jgi:hypothetical protein